MADNAKFPPEKIILFEEEFIGPQQSGVFFRLREKIDKYAVEGVTLSYLVDQIAGLINQITGKSDTVKLKKVSWPPIDEKDLAKKSTVYLKEIYLIARYKPENTTELEYALRFEIRCSEELSRQFPIPLSFDGLYLKVWQTTDKKILKEMAIV